MRIFAGNGTYTVKNDGSLAFGRPESRTSALVRWAGRLAACIAFATPASVGSALAEDQDSIFDSPPVETTSPALARFEGEAELRPALVLEGEALSAPIGVRPVTWSGGVVEEAVVIRFGDEEAALTRRPKKEPKQGAADAPAVAAPLIVSDEVRVLIRETGPSAPASGKARIISDKWRASEALTQASFFKAYHDH